MTINLDNAAKASLEAQGAITDETTLSGDLSGNLPGATVVALQGLTLPTTGFADGLGFRISGGQLILESLLTESSNFGGDVSGSQSTGLAVQALDGVTVDLSGLVSGQTLKFNGSEIVPAADTAGDVYTDLKTANYTAESKERVLCDSTSSAFTVKLPATPSSGDYVFVYDAAEAMGTNAVTIIGDGTDAINGSTTGLVANLNNAVVQLIHNGTEWRYFVISVRA
ncbi:hypothetical protein NVP1029O_14 [Vibrio phage 1.029.O._10N.261.55.A7]|nr:hypothetical protein NVP1029O_14 [Vibrio phage 1.029.O._10N.261.55.A7]